MPKTIMDRLVEDQDFYVSVQKTKIVLIIILGALAWWLHHG